MVKKKEFWKEGGNMYVCESSNWKSGGLQRPLNFLGLEVSANPINVQVFEVCRDLNLEVWESEVNQKSGM